MPTSSGPYQFCITTAVSVSLVAIKSKFFFFSSFSPDAGTNKPVSGAISTGAYRHLLAFIDENILKRKREREPKGERRATFPIILKGRAIYIHVYAYIDRGQRVGKQTNIQKSCVVIICIKNTKKEIRTHRDRNWLYIPLWMSNIHSFLLHYRFLDVLLRRGPRRPALPMPYRTPR